MPTLDQVVQVDITSETALVSRQGFGTGLILGCQGAAAALGDALTKKYTGTDAMLTDGLLETDPEYLAAVKYFSQSPRPAQVYLGKRAIANYPLQQYNLTPALKVSTVFELTIDGIDCSYTSKSDDTVAKIIDGLAAAIAAAFPATGWVKNTEKARGAKIQQAESTTLIRCYECITAGTTENADNKGPAKSATPRGQDITDGSVHWKYTGVLPAVVDGTTYMTIASPIAGEWMRVVVGDININRCFQDNANGGIATDLAAIWLRNKSWYGLINCFASRAETLAAAAWVEANLRLFGTATEDGGCTDSGKSDDIMSLLKALGYARTFSIFHPDPGEFADAAWMGKCLPYSPGSETWAFKTLAGITVDDYLTPDQQDAITGTPEDSYADGKAGNVYTVVGGISLTYGGLVAAREFIDKIRGTDALHADIQEHAFAYIASRAKVPLTDKGIQGVAASIRGSLDRFTEEKLPTSTAFLAASPEPAVIIPLASTLDTLDKQARLLRTLHFTATVAGAIHKLVIQGSLSY